MYQELDLSYDQWKTTVAAKELVMYYQLFDEKYVAIAVMKAPEQLVFMAVIMRDQPSATLTDYETNVLGSSTLKLSVFDAIASAV